ncbi:helix-turn-helix domain-containing protein [Heyndrickxia camelliae]|uniref:XRE family transcriptional regulator n=1 Tax=Heyndrickxia camelliae TaxID=1707093 RepID=A0A2N3LFV2_9BACI|nr:helix-turn-helix transcriptional regulator [Heyndrickxia camelliae]PKR83501.1 XRE family transcriptional regulator [Heyndrickxia camelliae]
MSQSIGKCLLPMLLKKRKWTQVDLEAVTGIHRNQLSEYINNKRTMSLKNARIIANALRCHIDDLYDWKV